MSTDYSALTAGGKTGAEAAVAEIAPRMLSIARIIGPSYPLGVAMQAIAFADQMAFASAREQALDLVGEAIAALAVASTLIRGGQGMKVHALMQDRAVQGRLTTDLAEAALRALGDGCSATIVALHLRHTATQLDPDDAGPSAVPPPSDGSMP